MNFYFHSLKSISEQNQRATGLPGYRATIVLLCSKRPTDGLPIMQDGLPYTMYSTIQFKLQWDIKLGFSEINNTDLDSLNKLFKF